MPTIDDLQNEMDRIMHEQNSRAMEEFEYYSPVEMTSILYAPLRDPCPVRLKKMSAEDYSRVPLLNQARYMMSMLQERGEIKLTAKGFLPVEMVASIYAKGFMKDDVLEARHIKLYKELDSFSIHLTRVLLEAGKLVKKRKGYLSLTKSGIEMVKDPAGLLAHLIDTSDRKLNWAYFDGYGENKIGKLGWAFSLIILHKYGKEKREDTFYAEKYFRAFPMLIDEILEPYYRDPEQIAFSGYSHRIFDHFLGSLGVIEVERERLFYGTKYITATDLLWKMFRVEVPNVTKGRN